MEKSLKLHRAGKGGTVDPAKAFSKPQDPEGLLKITDLPMVVGTDEGRLRITLDGRVALSAMLRGLRDKSPEKRMETADCLLELLKRDGYLKAFLREAYDSSAMQFSEEVQRAFSIGDKELNPKLKEIRKLVYTPPSPRHCMIIPIEEVNAAMKKSG